MIVLEGPDGGGKTTLEQFLCERLEIRSVHMGIPEPLNRPLDYWMTRIVDAGWPELIDRLHWSEDVYADAFRGGSALSDLDRWQLEGWLLAHAAVIVLCRPSRRAVLQNASVNLSKPHHAVADEVYDGFCNPWDTRVPQLTYDYELETAGSLLARLPREVGLPFDHEGIGTPSPRVVFVADRHGRCDGPCDSPFVLRSPSGDYLRRALDNAGLDLREYHLLNGWMRGRTLEIFPHPRLLSFQPSVFVALGNQAARALDELGVRHTQVPHPQYMKRFHAHKVKDYGEMLRRAANA